MGIAYRANPSTAPSGAEHFLSEAEAHLHAFGGKVNPEAVSATTDEATAALYGRHSIAYDVPKPVFERLPVGDLAQGEVVFSGSIPDAYRVGVTSR